MWRLTVKRFYKFNEENEFETSDEVHFESEYLTDIEEIIDKFREYGTGKYTYTITLEQE